MAAGSISSAASAQIPLKAVVGLGGQMVGDVQAA